MLLEKLANCSQTIGHRRSLILVAIINMIALTFFTGFSVSASRSGLQINKLPSLTDHGYLFVGSVGDNSIMRYDEITGAPAPSPGNTGARFVSPGSGGLFFPRSIILGPDSNLYVSMGDFGASPKNSGVLRYNGETGQFLDAFVNHQSGGGLGSPRGLVFGSDTNLYVSNNTNGASERGKDIERFDGLTGHFLDAFVLPNSGGINHPQGLVFGPDGNLYVADGYGNTVLRYNDTTGRPLPSTGNSGATFVSPGSGGLIRPVGIVFGPDDNLYVSSAGTNSILRYDGSTGAFIDAFVPSGSGGLFFPVGLVFGPEGNLYVSSGYSLTDSKAPGSVLRYDGMTGAFIDAFIYSGNGGLMGPSFLIFSESDPSTLSYNGNIP